LILHARLPNPEALNALAQVGVSVLGEDTLLCPKAQLMEATAILRRHGAQGVVTAQTADYIFETDDPLVAAFEAAISR
ncbi:MAG TPA: hypothetical protein VGH13_26185, partial [Xanthobacteraceae bacterium]